MNSARRIAAMRMLPPAARAARVGQGGPHWSPARRSASVDLDTGVGEAMDRAGSAHRVRRGIGPRCGDGESSHRAPDAPRVLSTRPATIQWLP